MPRDFDLNSASHCPGIPDFVNAYSLNITVTNTQGPGFILIYPEGGSQPTVSTLNYLAGQTVANAAIVPAGTNGGVTVIAGVSGTNLIIDVNGYFSYDLNGGQIMGGNGNSTGILMLVTNFDSSSGSTAIHGRSMSQVGGSAGVRGANGGGIILGPFSSAGVRGETGGGSGIGVFGLSAGGSAVAGYRVTGGGFALGTGAELGVTSVIGATVTGNLFVSGTKSFVEPHPTDASKLIQYISLEGNESGTYFRGRGKFQNGIARIHVPEDFRIVTDPEGLTVQITPIGGMATFGVLKMDLVEIVAQSSRDLEFSYLVQGVRHAYKDVGPIAENEKMFVPRSADERMPEYLPQALRDRLISNGTYRPDGTVNMETAHRLGWDRIWEDRSRPTPQPSPP